MLNLLEDKKREIEKKLEFFNTPSFTFNEEYHVYRYDGVKYDSVTTFLKTFKTPFNKDYWSKKKAIERGVDVSVILNEWKQKADTATDLGSRVHKYIEDFWGGDRCEPVPLSEDDTEYISRVNKFLDLYHRKFTTLVPLKSELRIFSRRWRLAGTIDQPFLFWDEKRQKVFLIIGDWKTNGEFKDDNHKKGKYQRLLRPFANLYENHHNEYSIQISIYRLILEEELGIETESGFLCHIGPEGEPKIYPAKDLREPLRAYLDQNRNNFDIFDIR
jgi:hypothetical protein